MIKSKNLCFELVEENVYYTVICKTALQASVISIFRNDVFKRRYGTLTTSVTSVASAFTPERRNYNNCARTHCKSRASPPAPKNARHIPGSNKPLCPSFKKACSCDFLQGLSKATGATGILYTSLQDGCCRSGTNCFLW